MDESRYDLSISVSTAEIDPPRCRYYNVETVVASAPVFLMREKDIFGVRLNMDIYVYPEDAKSISNHFLCESRL